MDFDGFLKALEASSIATFIRENELLFPWIESIHVLAISLVIGSIAIIDLRLIGVASLDRTVGRMTREVLPFTWGAFAVAAVTGGLLFSSNAVNYTHNFFFVGKMILLLLAGLNMAVFHLFTGRDVARWGTAGTTTMGAKIAGVLSLLIWITVVAFGRWIGFTLHENA